MVQPIVYRIILSMVKAMMQVAVVIQRLLVENIILTFN